MKVLLRDTQTGLFYVGPDRWTEDHSAATDFKRPDCALDQVSETKLKTIEVVVQFEGEPVEVPLTIVNGTPQAW